MHSLVHSDSIQSECIIFTIYLPDYLANRLQRVQKASASFVLGHFASIDDITKLQWQPIKEQLQWLLLKAAHKAIHSPT